MKIQSLNTSNITLMATCKCYYHNMMHGLKKKTDLCYVNELISLQESCLIYCSKPTGFCDVASHDGKTSILHNICVAPSDMSICSSSALHISIGFLSNQLLSLILRHTCTNRVVLPSLSADLTARISLKRGKINEVFFRQLRSPSPHALCPLISL